MNTLLAIAWRSLWNRRVTVLLTLVTLTISVTLLAGVLRLQRGARDAFAGSVSGIDLIVGARTHPVQLLLAAVFGIGDATHNVGWRTYRTFAESPGVAWTVPIALGDSHRGFRVVGTTRAYFERMRGTGGRLRFASGRAFGGLDEAVIGAEVARALGYEPAARIVLAHGTAANSPHQHDDHPFTVSGVLARTGTPVDRSVLVSLEAIEAIHLGWRSGTRLAPVPDLESLRGVDLTPKTITAFFVGVDSKIATFGVQRLANEFREEALTAILPGVALQDLWQLLGTAQRALDVTAAAVVAVGLLGMVMMLLATLNERRREMAILRAVGARPAHVMGLLLLEAATLSFLAVALSVGVLNVVILFAAPVLAARAGLDVAPRWPDPSEWSLLGALVLAGPIAGAIPGWVALRRSVADGLVVRT